MPTSNEVQALKIELDKALSQVSNISIDILKQLQETIDRLMRSVYAHNQNLLKLRGDAALTGAPDSAPEFARIAQSLDRLTHELETRNREVLEVQNSLAQLRGKNPADLPANITRSTIDTTVTELNGINKNLQRIQTELNRSSMLLGKLHTSGNPKAIHAQFTKTLEPLLVENQKLKEQIRQQKGIVQKLTESEEQSPARSRPGRPS